jgi:Tfp pilus assembly protein PilW
MAVRHPFSPPRRDEGGFTLMELMIAGVVAAIVLLALITMYITSMQAWDRAGARLALQRNASMALDQVMFDVRHGSRVEVGGGGTSLTIIRTTAAGDSTIASYQLVGDQLRNQYGVALVDRVTSLTFATPNGFKLEAAMSLVDDLGTSAQEADDATIFVESAAVCRNQAAY